MKKQLHKDVICAFHKDVSTTFCFKSSQNKAYHWRASPLMHKFSQSRGRKCQECQASLFLFWCCISPKSYVFLIIFEVFFLFFFDTLLYYFLLSFFIHDDYVLIILKRKCRIQSLNPISLWCTWIILFPIFVVVLTGQASFSKAEHRRISLNTVSSDVISCKASSVINSPVVPKMYFRHS